MSIEERAKRVAEQFIRQTIHYVPKFHWEEKLTQLILSEFSQPDVRETAKNAVELAEKLYYSHPGIKKECYKPDFIKVFMEIVAPFLGEAPKEEKK